MSEEISIRYLEARELHFEKTPGGFLSMKIKEEEEENYPRVHLYWCFPFSKAGEYVSVREQDDKEMGIIKSLEGFSTETLHLVLDELNSRYFTPTIQTIHSLKEEFGYTYWDVDTTAGRCRFTVQLGRNAVLILEAAKLLIHDVDGNRFELEDYHTVNAKQLRIIENLL